MEDEIMTTEEAAKFLKVSMQHVRNLTRQGELTPIRRGRRYTRYWKSELVAFLDRYTKKKGGAK